MRVVTEGASPGGEHEAGVAGQRATGGTLLYHPRPRVRKVAPQRSPVPAPQITSPANPAVKAVARLRDRRERDRQGRFVIDARRDLDRALAAGIEIDLLFLLDDGPESWPCRTISVSPAVLAKMSYRQNADGLLAVAVTPPPAPLPTAAPGDLFLVSVNVEKPGNLGAMARTAAAAGCRALIAAGPNVDLWNPNAIRNSTGAVFALPVCVAGEADVLAWLTDQPVQSVAAVVDAPASMWATELNGTEATAVVVGPEHAGLSDAWLAAVKTQVRIPQATGAVDSLNAATAAALLLFEVVRRRAAA